jgi:alkylation response protein AidB-like acyl-CoA dehydrogenase
MTHAVDEVNRWLTANWDATLSLRAWWSRLAESGWAVPDWPTDWYGQGLTRADAILVSRAIQDHSAVPAPTGFGVGMAGPTMLAHGDVDQKSRLLHEIIDGSVAYCQLFSEPGAGSDLAGLGTRAERDGDDWVVTGQKVWTSDGRLADKAMLLARTNIDVAKHAGLSYFIIDMHQPGVEVRPLREMTGRAYFNEVFLTEARVPHRDLIGGEGNGWAVANTTLALERALSGGGIASPSGHPGTMAGDLDQPAGEFSRRPSSDAGPSSRPSERLAALARSMGRTGDPSIRQDLVRLHTLEHLNSWTAQRARALALEGRELPGAPNLAKMDQNHAYRLGRDLTFRILGVTGTVHGYTPEDIANAEIATGVAGLGDLVQAALFAQGPPIYGGSDQIQRNIVGERALGLAREPDPLKGLPWRDLPTSR